MIERVIVQINRRDDGEQATSCPGHHAVVGDLCRLVLEIEGHGVVVDIVHVGQPERLQGGIVQNDLVDVVVPAARIVQIPA